jgi:hypothetical protein
MSVLIVFFYIGVSGSSLLFPAPLFVTCLERLISEYAHHSLHIPTTYLGLSTYHISSDRGFPTLATTAFMRVIHVVRRIAALNPLSSLDIY